MGASGCGLRAAACLLALASPLRAQDAGAALIDAGSSAEARGPKPEAPSSPEAQPTPEAQGPLADFQRGVAEIMLREQVPGAAVALVNDKGLIWEGGFGQSDPARGRQATPTTQFSAAALSPLVVGMLAARYAAINSVPPKDGQAEKAPLDMPVEAAALHLTNPFPDHPLTLANLLEQTAGLEDLAPQELLPAADPVTLTSDLLGLRPHPARWAPGSRSSPSRVGIAAAASQLERWNKKPFWAIADAELFQPLAMRETTFRADPQTLAAMAVGHGGARDLPWRPPLYWPALGLISTADDLGKLLAMVLARGRAKSGPAEGQLLLSPPILERLGRGRTLGKLAMPLSGLGSRTLILEGREATGQQGVFAGGASALIYFPDERVGYAVLLNAESPAALEEIAQLAQRLLLADRAAPEPIPSIDAPEELRRASGFWKLASVRLWPLRLFDELSGFVTVEVRGQGPEQRLALSHTLGAEQPLLHSGEGGYRAPGDAMNSVALLHRGDPAQDELVAPEGMYVRGSAAWGLFRLTLTGSALLAMLTSLLFALAWLPRALFGGLRSSPDLRLRAAPALASLVFVELVSLLLFSHQPLGAFDLTSLLVCALTLIFPALSLAALFEGLRGAPGQRPTTASRAVRAHALACSILLCWLSLELVTHGLAGIRTWAL